MNDLRRTSTSTTVGNPGGGSVMNEKSRPMETLIDDAGSRYEGHKHHNHEHDHGQNPARPSRDDAPFATSHRKFANPTPFGFFCLAISIFTVSLLNFNARGTSTATFLAAPAIWVGGLGQVLAGMWQMACGNTLGATGFTVYGLWWISYGFYLCPWSGIGAAYAANPAEMNYIAGFYDIAYFLFSMCLVVAALRASIALVAVFFTLGFVYFMNGIGSFVHHDGFTTAAAVFGFLNALAAFYTALAGLLTNETSYFLLPVGDRRPAAVRHKTYNAGKV